MQRMLFYLRSGLALFCLLVYGQVKAQNCGLDIYVANDQSGSVDAIENIQSRDFILKLAQSHPLGNANTQNRVAIANWETGYYPFLFPGAGVNYTISMADIMAYRNAARANTGGTDVYQALLNAYQRVRQTPVTGRSVKRIILLLTDASPGQVSPNIASLAVQIKAAGIIVAVMAIADAAPITLLQGTNVATTADLYFSASTYAALSANAVTTVNNLIANACSATIPSPTWDLTVVPTIANCGTGQVSYTVSNVGGANFSNTLSTTFYDGNPVSAGSKVLATDVQTAQSIAPGNSKSYTFTNAGFLSRARVWAVVNISTAGKNTDAPLPFNLAPRLLIAGEQDPLNNISSAVAATGCATTVPMLEVSNKFMGLSCDKMVSYQVQICNKGAVAAANVKPSLIPANNNFIFKNMTTTLSSGKVSASLAHPGTDNSTDGWGGYGIAVFPCVITDVPCSDFDYVATGGIFYTNAVFGFPVVSAGSGVPAGARIISAKLTMTGTGATLGGIKRTSLTRFATTHGNANNPGELYTNYPTTATISAAAGGAGGLDVTAIAQELVDQPGWTTNSPMAFFLAAGTRKSLSSAMTPALEVTYLAPFVLNNGDCATFTYVYDARGVAAGTYDASAGVTTTTAGALFAPNTNFTANGTTGLNGYNGGVVTNTPDNTVIPASTGCTQTAQPVTTTVVINPTSICAGAGNYVTATITINNPNTEPLPAGIVLENLTQNLNLTGAGARFAGEPYGFTTGLQLAQANVTDPSYPAVADALNGKTGQQSLSLFRLPAGTSSFKVDLVAGTAAFNLAASVSDLPSLYNMGGKTAVAQDATGVSISPAPTAVINCPASVTAAATVLTVTGTTTGSGGTTPVVFSSNTNGVFTANAGNTSATPNYNYTISDLDKAQGFINLQLSVLSANGCEAFAICQVPVTGTQLDYGDLPASYDFDGTKSPVAAGAMNPTTAIRLGAIAAGPDAVVKSGVAADGDGVEEDGIAAFPVITPAMTSYSVTVKYSSNVAANVCGWFDWNNNGYFDAAEGVCNAVPAAANGTTVLSWTNINNGAGAVRGMFGYARFRISSNSMNTYSFNGPTTNGEVEDYRVLPVALPLNLLSFDAVQQHADGVLNWSVTDEVNVDYYEVETSNNGADYRTIGRVDAATGNNSIQQYTFRHQHPAAGSYYYRLKMKDKNGDARYSGIRLLHFAGATPFVLVPNPAQDQIRISGLPVNSNIRIFDITGRQVKQLMVGETTISFSVATLIPGSYRVMVTDNTGRLTGSTMMIKE